MTREGLRGHDAVELLGGEHLPVTAIDTGHSVAGCDEPAKLLPQLRNCHDFAVGQDGIIPEMRRLPHVANADKADSYLFHVASLLTKFLKGPHGHDTSCPCVAAKEGRYRTVAKQVMRGPLNGPLS